MRFQLIDEVQWDIRFQYDPMKNGKTKTTCIISSVNNAYQGRQKYCPVSIGYGSQSVNDKFVKDTGRKVALARALRWFSKNKPLRQRAWQAYFNRKK